MKLEDIENLSFAELKQQGASIVESLGGGDLAKRYVQARTDAKQRDEKLAEYVQRNETLGRDVLEWQKVVADLKELAGEEKQRSADALQEANKRTQAVESSLQQANSRIVELEGIIARKDAAFRAALEG
jgi:hypothetical protein